MISSTMSSGFIHHLKFEVWGTLAIYDALCLPLSPVQKLKLNSAAAVCFHLRLSAETANYL